MLRPVTTTSVPGWLRNAIASRTFARSPSEACALFSACAQLAARAGQLGFDPALLNAEPKDTGEERGGDRGPGEMGIPSGLLGSADAGKDALAETSGRLDRRRGGREKCIEFHGPLQSGQAVGHCRPMCSSISERSDLQRPERVQLVEVAQIIASHTVTGSPNSSRSSFRALRTQVLTVPRGCLMRSAISLCERPSK